MQNLKMVNVYVTQEQEMKKRKRKSNKKFKSCMKKSFN